MTRKIVLYSPLPPVALATRLKEVLGGGKGRKAGVTGHGTEEDMLLYVYRPNFQNSFQTGLKATMAADGDGTRIEGRIGPPGSAVFFMWIWCGFLLFFIAFGAIGMIMSGASLMANALFFVIPAGMLLFGWGLWRLGTWNDSKDRDAILKFLADTVQAREA